MYGLKDIGIYNKMREKKEKRKHGKNWLYTVKGDFLGVGESRKFNWIHLYHADSSVFLM